MTSSDVSDEFPALSPDDAFIALGNETRIQALQVLGRAASPLSFTELRERVGMEDPGQFNYHLDKLKGHFVRQVGDAYTLRESGSRVLQSVLSGSVTGSMSLEPTSLQAPCPYCGADIRLRFAEERVHVQCSGCAGTYAGSETDARFLEHAPHGTIAFLLLPPAGLTDRSPREILDVAVEWTHLELLALANGICSRCSSTVEESLNLCEDHDAPPGVCETCNLRFAARVDYDCSNCTKIEERIPLGFHLTPSHDFQAVAVAQGINVTGPTWKDTSFFLGYEEEIVQMEPFRARLTFEVEDQQTVLSVDENLGVAEA